MELTENAPSLRMRLRSSWICFIALRKTSNPAEFQNFSAPMLKRLREAADSEILYCII